MNLLREVRRVHKKSMPIRIIFVLAFCVIFIVTTYAWFSTQKDIKLGGLDAYVIPWNVEYYVNSDTNEILDEKAVFTIEDLYPGMPNREEVVHVYNMGKASTNITYELKAVRVFGEDILTKGEDGKQYLQVNSKLIPITTINEGNVTKIFSADTEFPFSVSYEYDKSKLIGEYSKEEYKSSARATFKLKVSWLYESEGTDDAEKLAKDVLDTKFGKEAYKYYQDNEDTNAIEIEIKITSSMVYPGDDPDYPYDDKSRYEKIKM